MMSGFSASASYSFGTRSDSQLAPALVNTPLTNTSAAGATARMTPAMNLPCPAYGRMLPWSSRTISVSPSTPSSHGLRGSSVQPVSTTTTFTPYPSQRSVDTGGCGGAHGGTTSGSFAGQGLTPIT